MCVMLITLMFHRQNLFISFHKNSKMFSKFQTKLHLSTLFIRGYLF